MGSNRVLKITNLSPWLDHHSRTSEPTLVVLHADDGKSVDGTVETLKDRGLSYHYLIEPNGVIHKLIPADSVGYHAGSSYGPREQERGVSRKQKADKHFVACCSVNSYSVGIAFRNYETGHEPISKDAAEALADLLVALRAQFPSLKWISTHYWVSPGRKTDPAMLLLVTLEQVAKRVGLEVWRG